MNDNIVLQKRDRKLLVFLKDQRFCTFPQLRRHFFSSNASCEVRLSKLRKAGFLYSLSFSELLNLCKKRSGLMVLRQIGVKPRSKIYTSRKLKKVFSSHFLIHQFVLESIFFQLKKSFPHNVFIFPTDLEKMKSSFLSRKKEPVCDFSMECEEFKLAVEIESTMKSKNRYSRRLNDYLNSIYTHALYVYITKKHKKTLRNELQKADKIGLCHYTDPFEIETFRWGVLSLKTWLKKEKKGGLYEKQTL